MFLNVNGIKLYYEIHGEGQPVILLHGNGEDSGIFDALIPSLSQKYKVYAIDSRSHGKSEPVKPIHYTDMAEDIACFIKENNINNPMIYGFSDGGIIALLIAVKYPELLAKIAVSGANISPKGLKLWVRLYIWIVFAFTRNDKFRLMLREPDLKPDDLSKIEIPTLVLAGQRDFVKNKHTKLIAQSIKNSELKILRGENHESYVIGSDKLFGIITPFFES